MCGGMVSLNGPIASVCLVLPNFRRDMYFEKYVNEDFYFLKGLEEVRDICCRSL